MRRKHATWAAGIASGIALAPGVGAAERPRPQAFVVFERPVEPGPQITPLLRHQLDLAWQQDGVRRAAFAAVPTEAALVALQKRLRETALEIIGGLPERTPLNAQVVGSVNADGYRIEKLIFESLPGYHVTALLYVPDAPVGRKPAVLVACGHAPLGKAFSNYQEISARLAKRGYVVLCFDPVGQGERSQFWDAARGRSRYNLVCGEHAILGNLATLAGTSLLRFMVWDGMRAVDYLLTRPDVDQGRIAVTGTSGGGLQSTWIGALDERVSAILPSCFPTALPMRMANRIFEDPDSDPEQDPAGLVSHGVDHAGLLLLAYPRPLHLSAAVKDFVPIEGTRRSFREVAALYERFGHRDRIALSEGYHEHRYSAENQAAAFAFLDRVFGRPAKSGLDPVTTFDPTRLRCTPTGQVRVDLPGRSLPELVREYYRGHAAGGGSSLVELYTGQGYPGIRTWPVKPYRGGDVRGEIAWESKGSVEAGDNVIERYLLHHSERLELPLLHLHRATGASGRTVLRLGLGGKLQGSDWGEIEAALARGDSIVSFDPRGLGETRMRYKAASIDDPELTLLDEDTAYASPVSGVLANYVYNALLVGRPYFLEMIEDAEIAGRFAREKLGAQRLVVEGRGDSRTLAAAVAAVVPGVELAPLEPGDAVFSWSASVEQMRELWPIHYLMPGGAYLTLER